MKKRIFSLLLACTLSISILPIGAAAAGAYPRPDLPDVFQGDGLYITVEPWEVKTDREYKITLGTGFSEGFVPIYFVEEVRDDYGYVTGTESTINYADRDGNLLLDSGVPSYRADQAGSEYFSEGLCPFYDKDTGLFGYMDTEGDVVIEPQFSEISPFSGGLAAVQEVGSAYNEWVYIDTSGNKVAGPYDAPGSARIPGYFSEGLLPHRYYTDSATDEVFVGYLNEQGEPAITLYRGEWDPDNMLEFLGARNHPNEVGSHFSEGYAIIEDQRNGRTYPIYLIIDTEGNEVGRIDPGAPLTARPYTVVHDGLIVAGFTNTEDGGSVGIGAVDVHGNIVVEPGKIASGNAWFDSGVIPGRESLLIDKKGNTVIPYSFNEITGMTDEEVFAQYPVMQSSWALTLPNFDDGISLLQVDLRGAGGGTIQAWRYLLEVHEGTYTGPGKVYNAATGQITGGGTATPVQPESNTPSAWAEEQANTAISNGIVPEILQSAYTQATTRAEFCALAVDLYETVKGTEITERATFTDTTDENVQKMAGLGVVNGVGSGRFDANGTLTREQAATMLSRLAEVMGKPLTAQAPTFADNASISSWAADAVGQMQGSGVMGGVGNNTFSPQGSYTREQSIVTTLRLYEIVK